ncbi:hypothetical protein [Streptomyces sp. SD31]|uniref:hypothetical protein n=1 Tax=Streptomyces sp. SD31 TaxID=3452208 RepID=UPI003F8B504E
MRNEARALGAVLALVLLLPGCGSDDDDEEYPVTVLSEYRSRYDRIRTALAESASHLPQESPARNACSRAMTPKLSVADYEYESEEITDNAELFMEEDLTSPDVPANRDTPASLDRFTVLPGYLARGMRITGPKGPLGSNEFKVGPDYGESYEVEDDPGRRLGKILDAGLRMRYVVALRVLKYTPPAVKSFPEDLGWGQYAVGEATVDAFVIDLKRGDVPCHFRTSGETAHSVFWTEGTAEQAIYKDIRRSLSMEIYDTLRKMGAGSP